MHLYLSTRVLAFSHFTASGRVPDYLNKSQLYWGKFCGDIVLLTDGQDTRK